MKAIKHLLVLFCILMICNAMQALDFTGNDGTVYKNATLMKVMPDGIVVSYVDSEGFDDVKYVKTAQLPVDIIRKYGLTPQVSAIMNTQLASTHAAVVKQPKPSNPLIPQGLSSAIGAQPNTSYLTDQQKAGFDKLNNMIQGMPDQGILSNFINANESHLGDINEQIHEIDNPSDIQPGNRK